MQVTDPPHLECVEEALAGDPVSREQLAQAVYRRVTARMVRLGREREVAQEVAHETLVRVLGHLRDLRRVDRFWPWVFRIAANVNHSRLRREARRRTVPFSAIDDSLLETYRATDEDVAAGAARRELAGLAMAAMERLGDENRRVLALRCMEGRPHADIAALLGCSELAARCRFLRARRALGREMRMVS